ncbi:T9SS type A sorting domain-containing protein [Spirosoma aerolatum]|uniref:T9SS type A sorting domain-containing protein n=1 Tax=Spirosoma aerolatum TaxID=1211326 RepID=UPI0009AD1E07|nr:T9SS type A sorting domain-containing protein [Spirosoma aerolatum]
MTPYLRWFSITIQVRHCLYINLCCFLAFFGGCVYAQETLDTQPLVVTSVCAGSSIDVTAFRTFGSNTLSVELSPDGIIYSEIPASLVSASGRYEVTYRALIPASTAVGASYRVRVVSKNPPVTGKPSPTTLTVKARPAPPTIDSLVLDCQRVLPSSDLMSIISTTVVSGAEAMLYNANQVFMRKSDVISDAEHSAFFIPKPYLGSTNYSYPVKETVFFVTQSVNECESEKVKTVLRILYRPTTGPFPTNGKAYDIEPPNWPPTYYGTIAYCQNSRADPLNVNGHIAPPQNYQVIYRLLPDTVQSKTPPIPKTNVLASQTYEMALVPIDPTKGCGNYTALNTRLTVSIKPLATATLAGSQTILEGQPASLSVAFTGNPPWTFTYRDSTGTGLGNGTSVTTDANPYVLRVSPKQTTDYKLISVNNECGEGVVTNRLVVVDVRPLLAIEDNTLGDMIEVSPVPTAASLAIHIRSLLPFQVAVVEVKDLVGRTVMRQEISQHTASIALESQPVGVYLVQIRINDRWVTKRVVKF